MPNSDVRIVMWPEEPGGGWRLFSQPAAVYSAATAGQVLDVLHKAHQATENGMHAAGFLAYEAAPGLDTACSTHDLTTMPLAWFAVFDRVQKLNDDDSDHGPLSPVDWRPSMTRDEYGLAIEQIRGYLEAGDTYQVNYTMRLNAQCDIETPLLFQHLCRMQRAKYCASIETETFDICSASPELFFSLDGNTLVSRPMKGTSRRGLTSEEDEDAAHTLHESVKNRAENVMIVDMVRNDMGRIADAGTVHVPDLFNVEKYPTVLQMTSTVECTTSASFPDIIKVLFPCASITGAPKIRTMQIIRELEPTPRGIYTGCIGCLSPGRKAEFNVAIRTISIDKGAGVAEYGVGGGIVWDSDAENEYEECRVKASVLSANVPEFDLLETMLWDPADGYYLLEEHLKRLMSSATYFDYPLDMEMLRSDLTRSAGTMSTVAHKVRVLLDIRGRSRIETSPIPPPATGHSPRVAISDKPVNTANVFLYHKTTNRGVYEEARMAFPDFDDVLLQNERGEITESTIANVVIEKDGRLITPPVSSGLLPGVFRSHLLSEDEIDEEIISRQDLQNAEKVFLVNSVRKWTPVRLDAGP